MEPIPETSAAIHDLDTVADDDGFVGRLVAESDQVQALVPECVAMSVTLAEHGVTFTLVTRSTDSIMGSLSLPLTDDETVTGGVDLYATTAHAFHGHHERLAEILGASASGAVTDVDLGFQTFEAARRAPAIIRDAVMVEVATGMLAALLDIDVPDAQRRLTDSAARAALAEPVLARAVADLVRGDSDH